MVKMNIYLNFKDNTEDAFNFYKEVFGGEFQTIQRFRDTPDAKIPESAKDLIMHVALPIGDNLLMGTDAPEEMGFSIQNGNNFSIILDVLDKEEADKLFKALSEGGKVLQPLQDMFWGAYYGQVRDRFGVQWMLNYDPRQK